MVAGNIQKSQQLRRWTSRLPSPPSSPLPTSKDDDPQVEEISLTEAERRLSEHIKVRQIGNSSEGIIDLVRHTPTGELSVFKKSHSKWRMPPVNIDLCEEARKIRKLHRIAVHENIVWANFGMKLSDDS